MTELQQRIKKEAEQMYPSTGFKGKKYTTTDTQNKRDAYMDAALSYAEKLEKIREEVQAKRDQYCYIEGASAAVTMASLDDVLSIIDKLQKRKRVDE